MSVRWLRFSDKRAAGIYAAPVLLSLRLSKTSLLLTHVRNPRCVTRSLLREKRNTESGQNMTNGSICEMSPSVAPQDFRIDASSSEWETRGNYNRTWMKSSRRECEIPVTNFEIITHHDIPTSINVLYDESLMVRLCKFFAYVWSVKYIMRSCTKCALYASDITHKLTSITMH